MPNEIDILIESYDMQRKRMESVAPAMCQWFDLVLMQIHASLPKQEGGLLMGCPVWGADYVDRMIRYSLPTLGSDKNLEALSGKAVIVFYGIKADRPIIWKATRWLRQMNIHTVWRDIPLELMQVLSQTAEDKYAILSTVQNLLAIEAGHNGMALHMYMLDHAYQDGYFWNLARLGGKHAAIVQQGCSVNVESAAEDIEAWRQAGSGALSIPTQAMGAIILKHMHSRTSRTIMNGLDFPNQMPRSHQATWIGKDAIHMASAPQNIAWLCPQLCMDAPVAFTSTLDMLPPEYIPPGAAYMAGPDDGLSFCELSDPKRAATPEMRAPGDMDGFIYRHWAQVGFTKDYMEYFGKRCLIRIPEQEQYMPDAEIEAQHKGILGAVMAGHVASMEKMFRGQAPLRWPSEDEARMQLSLAEHRLDASKEAA
jgi:hypothetical protein